MTRRYTIQYAPTARKQFLALEMGVRARVGRAIDALSLDPRPPGCEKMRDLEYTYRIRIGSYRVVYSVLDDLLIVQVLKAAHRREVYR